jgi:hypothetical protein
VYDFFWGYGPDKVRQATYEGYPQRVGPAAMDVADDGRIALMDPVDERIIISNLNDGSYSSYPLPFAYGFFADLGFDPQGRLMVCDYQGEEVEETFGPDPVCYLLDPDGQLIASAPAYVRSPAKMSGDLQILEYSDSRLIAPFNSQAQPNSQETQRDKRKWEYPLRYVEGHDPYLAHYADIKQGVAFEVHSASPLGVLTEFEKTPQGYILVFSLGDRIRAVWIDPAGHVLKDATLPNSQHTEINFNGQVAVSPDGSLYAMSSTERGVEIHYTAAPSHAPTQEPSSNCSSIQRLPPDTTEAQQIVEEFVANYRQQYPTEYMGMAILNGVNKLDDWAVVTGSIAGEGKDVIAVRQTPQGYQIADFIHVVPLESPEELQTWVIQPLLEKLPKAPPVLFTCLEPSWLLAAGYPNQPAPVLQLAYVSTDNFTTEGVTEIKTVQSDGSNPGVLLHEPMLVMGLVSSPDGARLAFWGFPGSLPARQAPSTASPWYHVLSIISSRRSCISARKRLASRGKTR